MENARRTLNLDLIVDEVHEWNINMEVLLAWARKTGIKLVIMSATMDSERLSKYFGGAPVIDVPGRLHTVADRAAGASMVEDAAKLAAEGRNVLMFVPGKAEIRDTINALTRLGVNAELIPLHGQLNSEEQARAFAHFERPKIVIATNIAQTSITIDDIDAVVDSGLERRIVLERGVECLDILPISQAGVKQRRGRAGRTRPGIYIYHGKTPVAELPLFPAPEIERRRLDQTVLRLTAAGVHMEDLEFFHQPSPEAVAAARRTLLDIGLISTQHNVQKIGLEVAELPVEVHIGKMIAEARRRERAVPGVTREIINIAAVMETRGITIPGSPRIGKYCVNEQCSDLLVQLTAFKAAQDMPAGSYVGNGIRETSFNRAIEMRDLLLGRLELPGIGAHISNQPLTPPLKQAVLESIWSGMIDNVFAKVRDGWTNGQGIRSLPKDSVLQNERLIVGMPFSIGIRKGEDETSTLPLIVMASRLDRQWYRKNAPRTLKQGKAAVIKNYRAPRHPGDRKDRKVRGVSAQRYQYPEFRRLAVR